MLTVGDTFPTFSLKAVKGGPEGLKLDTAFTEISTTTDAGKGKLVFRYVSTNRISSDATQSRRLRCSASKRACTKFKSSAASTPPCVLFR